MAKMHAITQLCHHGTHFCWRFREVISQAEHTLVPLQKCITHVCWLQLLLLLAKLYRLLISHKTCEHTEKCFEQCISLVRERDIKWLKAHRALHNYANIFNNTVHNKRMPSGAQGKGNHDEKQSLH